MHAKTQGASAPKADVRPAYLTLAQVSQRIATPAETIRYWVHLGKLRATKPGRQVLIREDDLEAFMAASVIGEQRIAKAKLARAAKTRRVA